MTVEQHIHSLIEKARNEIHDGYLKSGRAYLERALAVTQDPNLRARICYLYAQSSSGKEEKMRWLKETLAYQPTHPEARRELALLEGRLQADEVINPDALPAQSAASVEVQADRFVCPKCGARMVYAPDGRTLHCEYCDAHQHIARQHKMPADQDFFVGMATRRGHQKLIRMQTFRCQGCGAEFTLSADEISATCAWCNSPHIVRVEKQRDLIPPDGVIPHALTRPQVLQILAAWAKREKRQPDGQVQPPRGIYLPIWTFDIVGTVRWRGQYKPSNLTSYHKKKRPKPEERNRSGEYPVHFDDLIVLASRIMDKDFRALLPTYRLGAIQEYKPAFLADWPAHIYDIPLAKASLKAREKALRQTREDIRLTLPADIINLRFNSAEMQISAYKLVLLPVWHTTWPEGGQNWPLLVNGQTGQVVCRVTAKLPKWMNWLDDIFSD